MRLAKAARFGDKTPATDAYGTASFLCQIEPLSLFKIDGVAVRKRSMSCAPDVAMPARGVITIDGEQYLVGTGTPDFWKGQPIRRNYVLQGADGLAKLTTIAGELGSSAGTNAYAAKVFNRYLPESADSSKYPPQYQIFLAGGEDAPADSLILLDGDWFLVKESYVSTSGLRIAMSNLLDEPVFETALFANQEYDPVTDTYGGTSAPVKAFRVKWTEHYEYLSKASIKFETGDLQVFIRQADMPNVGSPDAITLSDGLWRVLSVVQEGLLWSIHVRRA